MTNNHHKDSTPSKPKSINSLLSTPITLILFLLINAAFIWKYVSRTSVNPAVVFALWLLVMAALWLLSRRFVTTERGAKWSIYFMLCFSFTAIAFLLMKIDPMSVNVDRWSATTYFLDGLFKGIYPYGIHTHVCETNFPSPFPLWHYINLPFWLMGDVGIGLFCFLTLFITAIRWFTQSWRSTFIATLFLLASPAYWWEVVVRSDGLSNSILVFCLILYFERKAISFQHRWVFTSIVCALSMATRSSAIIPVALYQARSFFKAPLKRQVLAVIIIAAIVFAFFAPYMFWDTTTWVFFTRNPFMSQTSTGSPVIFVIMAGIALWLVFRYNHHFHRYIKSTACFIFVFFLISIIYNHFVHNADLTWMEDADFDISYLSLSLPYCLLDIANTHHTTTKPLNSQD